MKYTNKSVLSLLHSFSLSLFLIIFAVTATGLSFAEDTQAPKKSTAEQKKSNNVTFNFVDVDLAVVTKFISEITGKNFIFDDRVKGKITIIAPSKLSIDDAYALFTSVLELKGYTVVPSGVEAFKIIPSMEAKQQGLQISTEGLPENESFMARLISVRYITAEDAMKFLQPLISKEGHISVFGPGNLLLVVDAGSNIEKVLSLIDLIDKQSTTEMPELVILKYASADTVARLIMDGFGRQQSRLRAQAAQQQTVEIASAIADQRLNAVILFGDRTLREAMKSLIRLLDVQSPEAQGRINVFFLENADATELGKVLDGMIKGTPQARPGAPGQPGAPVTPFEAVGGITITPDKATNSLVIVASPADYQNISLIVKQLDRRRKQVYVEAMIVEASIDKLQQIGAKWRAVAKQNGNPVVIGGVGQIDSSALQSVLTGLSGMTVGGMGNFLDVPLTTVGTDGSVTSSTLKVPGFAALFNLSEFKDAVKVLSTPQLLTSDNKEAEIVVGENVPFISKRERDLTTTGTVLNSIERKDVGITLRLTPQITEGNYVRLDIYQEISSLKQQSDTLTVEVGPTTTKRSTKTSVVVRDNQTVVIGGLMQEKEEETVTKMPLLGDIPLLGYLFKQKSVEKTKTNLLVFLTPHIVKEADSLETIRNNKEKEFAAANEQYIEGEIVVVFKEGVTNEAAKALITELGASLIGIDGGKNTYRIRLKKGQKVKEAIDIFSSMPEVQSAEPNYSMKIR